MGERKVVRELSKERCKCAIYFTIVYPAGRPSKAFLWERCISALAVGEGGSMSEVPRGLGILDSTRLGLMRYICKRQGADDLRLCYPRDAGNWIM